MDILEDSEWFLVTLSLNGHLTTHFTQTLVEEGPKSIMSHTEGEIYSRVIPESHGMVSTTGC